MMPTVNLYIDRMNSVEPVRVADVYAVTQNRASNYTEAAAKIGLTTREYAEFRQALTEGGAMYVRLPRRIDAMAGVHRNGHVYALKNVVVPAGTMGWTVNLADGVQVIVPQICSNLSMNRPRAVASVPAAPKKLQQHQAKRVAAGHYVNAVPAAIPETPVVFTPPVTVAPTGAVYAAAPAAAVPAAAVVGGTHSALPFLGLLAPVFAALAPHGGSTSSIPAPVAKCSLGSNANGVCQQ